MSADNTTTTTTTTTTPAPCEGAYFLNGNRKSTNPRAAAARERRKQEKEEKSQQAAKKAQEGRASSAKKKPIRRLERKRLDVAEAQLALAHRQVDLKLHKINAEKEVKLAAIAAAAAKSHGTSIQCSIKANNEMAKNKNNEMVIFNPFMENMALGRGRSHSSPQRLDDDTNEESESSKPGSSVPSSVSFYLDADSACLQSGQYSSVTITTHNHPSSSTASVFASSSESRAVAFARPGPRHSPYSAAASLYRRTNNNNKNNNHINTTATRSIASPSFARTETSPPWHREAWSPLEPSRRDYIFHRLVVVLTNVRRFGDYDDVSIESIQCLARTILDVDLQALSHVRIINDLLEILPTEEEIQLLHDTPFAWAFGHVELWFLEIGKIDLLRARHNLTYLRFMLQVYNRARASQNRDELCRSAQLTLQQMIQSLQP